MEYSLAMKRDELPLQASTWMDLGNMVGTEDSQL